MGSWVPRTQRVSVYLGSCWNLVKKLTSTCPGFLFCLECHGSLIQVEEVAIGADTGARLGRVGPALPSLAVRPRQVAPLSSSSSSSYSWGEFISSGRPAGGKVRSSAGFSRDHFFKDTNHPVL